MPAATQQTISMRVRPCALCASWDFRADSRYPSAQIELEPHLCRCVRCGLETYQPQPAEEALPGYYGSGYYEEGYFALEQPRRHVIEKALGGRLRGYFAKGVRVLDAGAGPGFWMQALANRGCDVEGYDISEASRKAIAGCGFRAYANWDEIPANFQVVLAADMLGHLTEPAQLLKEVRARLRPGGCLILRTPYYESAWRQFETFWAFRTGGEIPGYPTILWRFSPGHLNRLVEANGFQVESTFFEIQTWATGSVKWRSARWLSAGLDLVRGVGDEFFTIARVR